MSRTGRHAKTAMRMRNIVRRTLDFFREKPSVWAKGHFDDGETVCLVGAFRRFSREEKLGSMYGDVAAHALTAFLRSRQTGFTPNANARNFGDVPSFNDRESTTIDDIYWFLEGAEHLVQQDEFLDYTYMKFLAHLPSDEQGND